MVSDGDGHFVPITFVLGGCECEMVVDGAGGEWEEKAQEEAECRHC